MAVQQHTETGQNDMDSPVTHPQFLDKDGNPDKRREEVFARTSPTSYTMSMTAGNVVESTFRLNPVEFNIVNAMMKELRRAKRMYPKHPSYEHSLCVLMEEVDELKREIYLKPDSREDSRIAEESIQVAAMAIRLLTDSIPQVAKNEFKNGFNEHPLTSELAMNRSASASAVVEKVGELKE